MGYLLVSLKKEKERTAAFQALGLLVVAVRAEIQQYLTKILEIIKAALPPKDFAHKSVTFIRDTEALAACSLCVLYYFFIVRY